MDFIFEILTKFAFRQYTLLPICDEEKYEKNSEKDQKIAKIWMKSLFLMEKVLYISQIIFQLYYSAFYWQSRYIWSKLWYLFNLLLSHIFYYCTSFTTWYYETDFLKIGTYDLQGLTNLSKYIFDRWKLLKSIV